MAVLLGVSRQRVQQLVRADAPPVAAPDMGKVWDGQQLRKWAEGYQPRTRS